MRKGFLRNEAKKFIMRGYINAKDCSNKVASVSNFFSQHLQKEGHGGHTRPTMLKMMPPSKSDFTLYHMKCINSFKWTALSRSVISQNSKGVYSIKSSPILARIVFFIYFANTLAKLVFLACLVTDRLEPIEFMDKICGLNFLLCCLMVCIAYNIWRRYPLYGTEVIYRLWEIENRIYRRLGMPREIKWEAEERHKVTIWAHGLLTCLGCCSLTIQFYAVPKYCVFTYSLLEMDSASLRAIFCFHEILFLSHAWSAMACSNGLCSFEAVNLSLIIKQMTKAVNDLANGKSVDHEANEDSPEPVQRISGVKLYDSNEKIRIRSAVPSQRLQNSHSISGCMEEKNHYNFGKILHDYQQLMLASEEFNTWVGYKIVGLSICGFCQYISSTYMAFQVLRMPGTSIADIWFYIQDCTVAVYVTFRVFDCMSIVVPASDDFFLAVKRYMGTKAITGGHNQKFHRVLRRVSLKLGPNPLRRETVLNTMQMLASYYVCVALW